MGLCPLAAVSSKPTCTSVSQALVHSMWPKYRGLEFIEYLIKARHKDPLTLDSQGESPLALASEMEQVDIVSLPFGDDYTSVKITALYCRENF